jgi:flavin reductase (DIM6/NTAB) family NADH-FMN oxidoreductase RutF
MTITPTDLLAQDTHYRRAFMNTLPGPRSAHLIATKGHRGSENVAVFNTIVHLQASPAMIAFVLRPLTVPRETYHNILATGHYTINTIHPTWLDAAHQTSANYPIGVSEFTEAGLETHYSKTVKAPYVANSPVKIGLEYVETHEIHGGTRLVVGRVIEIILPDEEGVIAETGHVNHGKLDSLVVAGLDTYYTLGKGRRMNYARTKK